MKICFDPKYSYSNKYIQKIIGDLENRNIEVYSLKEILFNIKIYLQIKVIHLNWYMNLKTKNIIFNHIETLIRIILIYLFNFTNKKVVWTFHNKSPHNIGKKNKLLLFLKKTLIKRSNIIIIHNKSKSISLLSEFLSNYEINSKVIYIPHGNYINLYPSFEKDYKEKYNINDNDLVFLLFGAIKPYKNTELLINIFNNLNLDNIVLLIAGNPQNREYEVKLKQIKAVKDIIFDFRFIKDSEICLIFNTCDIVVLPYDKNSVLNSGTIYLAFSNKKTVLAPNIGTLEDISSSFYYTYDYKNEKMHYEVLKTKILQIYNEENNKIKLQNKGIKAYKYIKKNHDWKDALDSLYEIYCN